MTLLFRILAIVFGFQVMLNMTRPVVSLHAIELGANAVDIGLLASAYAFLPLFLALYAGRYADRVGDRLPTIVGMAIMMIGLGLPFIWVSLPAIYISQALAGVAHIILNISLQNLVGRIASPEQRDQYYGWFSMATALGGVFGPVLGGYIADSLSYEQTFAYSVAAGMIPMLLAFFVPIRYGNKGQAAAKKSSPAKLSDSIGLLNNSLLRKALMSSALVLYSRDIFVAYFPILGADWGMSNSMIGWLITIQGIAMVAVRVFLTQLTNRFTRDAVLIGSVFVAGICFIVVPFTTPFFLLVILCTVMGLGLGVGQPLSLTTTFNASPPDRTCEVLGLRQATNRLSQLIAPLFFGLVGSWVGVASVFYVSGLFLVGGAFASRPGQSNVHVPSSSSLEQKRKVN